MLWQELSQLPRTQLASRSLHIKLVIWLLTSPRQTCHNGCVDSNSPRNLYRSRVWVISDFRHSITMSDNVENRYNGTVTVVSIETLRCVCSKKSSTSTNLLCSNLNTVLGQPLFWKLSLDVERWTFKLPPGPHNVVTDLSLDCFFKCP